MAGELLGSLPVSCSDLCRRTSIADCAGTGTVVRNVVMLQQHTLLARAVWAARPLKRSRMQKARAKASGSVMHCREGRVGAGRCCHCSFPVCSHLCLYSHSSLIVVVLSFFDFHLVPFRVLLTLLLLLSSASSSLSNGRRRCGGLCFYCCGGGGGGGGAQSLTEAKFINRSSIKIRAVRALISQGSLLNAGRIQTCTLHNILRKARF